MPPPTTTSQNNKISRRAPGGARNAYLPSQLTPSPIDPSSQVQLYEPIVFVHVAFVWQLSVYVEHSSTSKCQCFHWKFKALILQKRNLQSSLVNADTLSFKGQVRSGNFSENSLSGSRLLSNKYIFKETAPKKYNLTLNLRFQKLISWRQTFPPITLLCDEDWFVFPSPSTY